MSEFSDSFQAYTSDRGAVIAILRGVGVSGLIAGSNARCVSFLIDDPEREEDVLAASPGVIARYQYGEDHGLWIRFYRGGEKLTAIVVVWDPDHESYEPFESEQETQERAMPASEVAQQLARAGVLGDAEAGEMCRLLEAFSPEELDARERLMEALPRLLGFAAFRWLSTAYAQGSDPEEMRELFPGAEVVEID